MGCSSCGSVVDGTPKGCKSNGGCSSSSCNKMNTYDWLSDKEVTDPSAVRLVEVSFKKGSTKDFFINENPDIHTGMTVAVDGDRGYNVGLITLSGELVKLQMKKKGVKDNTIKAKVKREATEEDLKKLKEARALEIPTLIRARVIARNLGINMKIGDIEFQADKKKATFYYTAEGRIDFRELVRNYSNEFRIKVEMKQIGARQESARIGGLGSCGRELCCSTWLSKFKSVSTSAARYQNLSINQTKLSGQCGRLKCCLNYELDTYLEVLKEFPKKVDYLKTKHGKAQLIKMDIFKGLMYYSVFSKAGGRGMIIALDKDRVAEIKQMNKDGEFPEDLISDNMLVDTSKKEASSGNYSDVTGVIELPMEKKKPKNKRKNNKGRQNNNSNKNNKSKNRSNPKGESKPNPNQKKKPNKNRNRNKNNKNTKSDGNSNPSNNNPTPNNDK